MSRDFDTIAVWDPVPPYTYEQPPPPYEDGQPPRYEDIVGANSAEEYENVATAGMVDASLVRVSLS